MPDVVVIPNEILNILVLLGILGLIGTFLIKFYNILTGVQFYDLAISVIILAIGTIAYLFIEIGLFLTVSQNVEEMLLEFNIYFWFARVFFIMIWVFWFVEIIMYAAFSVTEPLERMEARKEERKQRLLQFYRI